MGGVGVVVTGVRREAGWGGRAREGEKVEVLGVGVVP